MVLEDFNTFRDCFYSNHQMSTCTKFKLAINFRKSTRFSSWLERNSTAVTHSPTHWLAPMMGTLKVCLSMKVFRNTCKVEFAIRSCQQNDVINCYLAECWINTFWRRDLVMGCHSSSFLRKGSKSVSCHVQQGNIWRCRKGCFTFLPFSVFFTFLGKSADQKGS